MVQTGTSDLQDRLMDYIQDQTGLPIYADQLNEDNVLNFTVDPPSLDWEEMDRTQHLIYNYSIQARSVQDQPNTLTADAPTAEQLFKNMFRIRDALLQLSYTRALFSHNGSFQFETIEVQAPHDAGQDFTGARNLTLSFAVHVTERH